MSSVHCLNWLKKTWLGRNHFILSGLRARSRTLHLVSDLHKCAVPCTVVLFPRHTNANENTIKMKTEKKPTTERTFAQNWRDEPSKLCVCDLTLLFTLYSIVFTKFEIVQTSLIQQLRSGTIFLYGSRQTDRRLPMDNGQRREEEKSLITRSMSNVFEFGTRIYRSWRSLCRCWGWFRVLLGLGSDLYGFHRFGPPGEKKNAGRYSLSYSILKIDCSRWCNSWTVCKQHRVSPNRRSLTLWALCRYVLVFQSNPTLTNP